MADESDLGREKLLEGFRLIGEGIEDAMKGGVDPVAVAGAVGSLFAHGLNSFIENSPEPEQLDGAVQKQILWMHTNVEHFQQTMQMIHARKGLLAALMGDSGFDVLFEQIQNLPTTEDEPKPKED
jgi:hypothetical protein